MPVLEGDTNTITAELFVRELEARGSDSERALAAAELTRELVRDARAEISWAQCIKLIQEALRLTPADDLGVLAGTRAALADLDLPGLYLRSASNGREAFEFHREHREAFEPSPLTDIYMANDALAIALLERQPTPAGSALAECVMAASLTIVAEIVGPIAPLEVRFRHRRPEDDRAHRRVFGSVRFESDIDALFLPRELFDRAMPHRDDTIRAVLEPYVMRLIAHRRSAQQADLAGRALDGIRQELAAGRVSADALAKRLRLSPRSLRRSLALLGTSYSALLAQARRELAMRYALDSPQPSGPQLAARLGYADAHAFYRAFKRWTGVSLSAYREQTTPSDLKTILGTASASCRSSA